jgi:hypothetical protein
MTQAEEREAGEHNPLDMYTLQGGVERTFLYIYILFYLIKIFYFILFYFILFDKNEITNAQLFFYSLLSAWCV